MIFMRKFKILLCFLLLISVIISLSGCEAEQKLVPTEEFFVNDFAGVMDEADKNAICEKGRVLQEKTTAQAVVATVNDIGGGDISEYATELGREWKLGDKEKNNGVLILLALEERQVYIAVGYGLEGALPDSKTGRLLDNYAVPYFKDDNFSIGLLKTYEAVVNEVYLEYGMETDEGYIPAEQLKEVREDGESDIKSVIVSWVILSAIVMLYMLFFKRRGVVFVPMGGGFHGGNFRGGGSSGGFGGFSGGGGSFGGGGAGRGF